MLSQPMGMSPITITTKWDGAPAIDCGKNPENGMFFVGTKSVFNKGVPKIGYTEDLIDYHYPNFFHKFLKFQDQLLIEPCLINPLWN